METFFPPEFAGCLHDSTTLKARLPRFAELAELLKEALHLWLEAINCERLAFLRQRIEEVIEDNGKKHTTYKGVAFGQGAYLIEANEEFLKRTGRLLNSIEVMALRSSHQWGEDAESDSSEETVEDDPVGPATELPGKRRRRERPVIKVETCTEERTCRATAFCGALGTLQQLYPTLSALSAAVDNLSVLDAEQLTYFSQTFAIRMYCWDKCRRGRQHWDIESRSRLFSLGIDMRNRRVGVPYRLLNKASVWLYQLCNTCLSEGASRHQSLLNVVMNTIIYRTWWNNRDYSMEGLRRFAALGGSCIECPGYGPAAYDIGESFEWEKFHKAAACARSRSNAYNPGAHGCRRGEDIIEAWIQKLLLFILPSLNESMSYFTELAARTQPAGRRESIATLKFCQKLCGKFVGYQVALDLGYVLPSIFNETSHVHVGPGALTVLKRIFVHAPWSPEGMNNSTSAGRAAGAFVNELRRHVESHAAAQALRQCCSDLRICLPCSNDVEYHLCELRPLEHYSPGFWPGVAGGSEFL